MYELADIRIADKIGIKETNFILRIFNEPSSPDNEVSVNFSLNFHAVYINYTIKKHTVNCKPKANAQTSVFRKGLYIKTSL